MDTRLFDRIYQEVPKINERLLNGLAVEHLKPERVMDHIVKIISCAQEQYPEGLVLEDCVRCSPIEEYNVITRGRGSKRGSNKRTFDLAKSDVYMVKFLFRYKGEPLYPQYLYLPAVRDGGLMYVSGKLWSISPVLADKLFSIDDASVFIPMPRGKVTFYQTPHSFVADGQRVSDKVVYSALHNSARRGKGATSTSIHLGRVHTTMMHYLLCKYGFDGTFKRYADTKVLVMHKSEATADKYPPEDWIVCTSSMIKPIGVRIRNYLPIASNIALVIPRVKFTPLVKSMVAGFYYVVDHFPDSMEVDYVTGANDTWQWKVLMGYVLWGDEPTKGKLVEDVEAHLKSLDGYVDFEVRRTMREQGLRCNDIYDLFVYIIENMGEMLMSNSNNVSSMYGKQLMILRYVLSDINNEMFQFLFKITSNSKKAVTKESIEGILSDYFKPKLIFRITSGKGHGEVSSVSCPGDNKFFKITSVLVQQSETAGKGKNRDTKPVDRSLYLDASQAEVGSYCVLPKSNPFGRNRINPFLQDDPNTGDIIRNPAFVEMLDDVNRRIKR